jgi:hypothetical protein
MLINDGSLFCCCDWIRKQGSWYNRESASDLGEYSVFLGILVFTLVVGSIFVMSLKTTPSLMELRITKIIFVLII